VATVHIMVTKLCV